jgi:hypothetical protein
MGFEAFVQCFKDGDFDTIPMDPVRAAFGSFLSEDGPYDWRIYYNELNSCDVMLQLDDKHKKRLRGFTVLRPCADRRFWDAIMSILKMGNLVLYFPAHCSPLVADHEVIKHLPPSLIEGLGTPKCITKGKDIPKHVRAG